LLRPLLKLIKIAGKALWRRWTHDWNFRRVAADGIAEPAKRRYMLSYGEHAEMHIDGKSRIGRSGDEAGTRDVMSGQAWGDLWWLLELPLGVTEAHEEGEDPVRGTSCRRITTRVDLSVASAASAEGLRTPSVDRFEDLLALPLTVWIDGTYVRRVRYNESPGISTLTLDLWEFGVDTTKLDWSRLPTSSTPGK
jgi:hypothetical protein